MFDKKKVIRGLLLSSIGLQRSGKLEEIPVNQIKRPDWYRRTIPRWSEKFQKEISKRIEKGQDLYGRDWLLFCLRFAETVAYRDVPGISRLVKRLKKRLLNLNPKAESLLHLKEKMKAIFWLIDSGLKIEWIKEEGNWENHRADVLISIPLEGFINVDRSALGDLDPEDFAIQLAVEVGNWHKNPRYLYKGVPIVWIPYRNTPVEEIVEFLEGLSKTTMFQISHFVHYVHVFDETLGGIFIKPVGGKEK